MSDPLEEIFGTLFSQPALKPGQKMSIADAHLMHKGGIGAFFKPGLTPKEALEGRISKGLFVVESDSTLRKTLKDTFKDTAFDVFASPSYEEALKTIEFYKRMEYALFADKFPEKTGGKPRKLADKLYDAFNQKWPEGKVFVFAETPTKLAKPYAGIIQKKDGIGAVYRTLITDAEGRKPHKHKILVGDDHIEQLKGELEKGLQGMEVDYVATPQEVIKKAGENRYCIIITDLQYTPEGQEGFDVLEKVKDKTANLLLWTAAADNTFIREMGKQSGALAVYSKKQTPEMLADIRKNLGLKGDKE